MTAPLLNRPAPITEAFKSVGTAIAFIGSVVTALVGWGVFTAAQGDATTGLLGLIPGAVTAVTQVLTAFGVAKRAAAETTPVSDPATVVNGQLVQLIPDPDQLAEALARRAA
jgi:hypothetical protein